jgi:hypothetical protein
VTRLDQEADPEGGTESATASEGLGPDKGVRALIVGLAGPGRAGPAIAVLVYLILTLSGATTSSMGISSLRQDPARPLGTQYGTSRVIRGDEWLVQTPLDLGRLVSGSSSDSPLAEDPDIVFQVPGSHVTQSIVFFDGDLLKLGGVFPQRMLFAAYWWLPSLLVVLAMPAWMRRLGAKPHLAWLATGLTVLAPATAWWSLFPMRILGFALAGSYLMMVGAQRLLDGKRVSAVVCGVAAAILLARLPTFYTPWSISIGVPVVLATLAWILWPPGHRKLTFGYCGGVSLSAVVLFGLCVLESHAAFTAELHTIYPGLRHSTGQLNSPALLFGAPVLGYLQTGRMPVTSNQSELSSAYTVTLLWAAVVWIATARRGWDRERAAVGVLGLFSGLWIIWSSVNIGGPGNHIPIINLVPSFRAAQTVGYLGVVILALVLSRTSGRTPATVTMAAAACCGVATAYGGSSVQVSLPTMRSAYVLAVAFAVGVLVYLVTRFRDRSWPVVLVVALAAAQVAVANPLIFGFGDLRDSSAARTVAALGKQARAEHSYWVTDSSFTDALFIANGVPTVSGRQISGPNAAEWRKLDPTSKYEQFWNRGSSTVEFGWTNTSPAQIGLFLSQDHILVHVDPCTLARSGIPIAGIVSSKSLTESCLTARGTIEWDGTTRYLYNASSG